MLKQSDILREPMVTLSSIDEGMIGEPVQQQLRTLADLKGLFADTEALNRMDASTLAYRVQTYAPDGVAQPGSLCYGVTFLQPGNVGGEYFMTKGHFHVNSNTAEFYRCAQGQGMLLLMDEQRNGWAERMAPGSLHYIAPGIAHRLANIGDEVLCVHACWPADSGHDYDTIARKGFSVRAVCQDGQAALLKE